MSLAITAAPIDSDNNVYSNVSDNAINKKRNAHNRTQKRINSDDYDSDKVNSVIQSIHRSSVADNSESSELGEFNPISPPTSMGVENTKFRENFANKNDLSSNNNNNNNTNTNINNPIEYSPDTDKLNYNTLAENFLNSEQVQEYYKKLLPTYNQSQSNSANSYHNTIASFNQGATSNYGDANSILLEKLNYMINLLEEQKDERTNNVTEEVVLYSFLGIFIIFIVDSFARVGKYTR